MKIHLTDKIFKILNSDLPETYQGFTQALPNLLSPASLPSPYNLRYQDDQDLISVNNERSYRVMLQDMGKSPNEMSLFIFSEEYDEQVRLLKMKMISSMLSEQAQTQIPRPRRKASGVSITKKEEDIPFIVIEDAPSSKIENVDERNLLEKAGERHASESLQSPELSKEDGERESERRYTFENVEFVVNEVDILKKRLSNKEEKAKNSKKGRSKNSGLLKELKNLEEDMKKSHLFPKEVKLDHRRKIHSNQDEDLELIVNVS